MSEGTVEMSEAYNELNLGEQLKQARQEKKLTTEDVARELRLSVKRIVALENNDFSNIPAAMYIRGYLRMYANLVDVPAAQFTQPFERMQAVKKKPAPVKLKKRLPLSVNTINQKWVRILTYAFFGFILVSMMMWWWGNTESKTSTTLVADPSLNTDAQFKQKLTSTLNESVHKAPMMAHERHESLTMNDADEYEYYR